MTVAIVAGFVASAAGAETISMTASLSGANEVPQVDTRASGGGKVVVDTERRAMTWIVDVKDLSAPLSAAHFHGPSSTAQNAGIMVPIAKQGEQSPFTGSATLSAEQMADLLAGRWYINIHTPNHPPGEIRGQVTRN
jgi:hypothetical protein